MKMVFIPIYIDFEGYKQSYNKIYSVIGVYETEREAVKELNKYALNERDYINMVWDQYLEEKMLFFSHYEIPEQLKFKDIQNIEQFKKIFLEYFINYPDFYKKVRDEDDEVMEIVEK